MQVKKGIVILIGEETNELYKMKTTCEVELFEKIDGNYNEIIAKINDRKFELFDITSEALVDEQHSCDEWYKTYPNMSLDEFYEFLSIPNYSITYKEDITTI